jgi:hypothetical protein
VREGGARHGRRQAGEGGSEQPATRNPQDMLPVGTGHVRPQKEREVHLTSYALRMMSTRHHASEAHAYNDSAGSRSGRTYRYQAPLEAPELRGCCDDWSRVP